MHIPQAATTALLRSGLRGLVACTAMIASHTACAQSVYFVNAATTPGGNGQSWTSAFQTVQAALDQASTIPEASRNVEVWVAQGEYRPTAQSVPGDPRSVRFQPLKHTRLLGGFAGTETAASQRNPYTHTTVLTGDLLGNDGAPFTNREDNAYNVVYAIGSDSSAVIDGFTIRDGDGSVGAGVFVATPVTIRRCTIFRNRAGCCGGGVYVSAAGDTSIDASRIIGNQWQGIYVNAGNLQVSNSLIAGNTSSGDGGALAVALGSLAMYNSTVAFNHADGQGGAAHMNLSGIVMKYCVFYGNTASAGAALFRGSACSGSITYSLLNGDTIWNTGSPGSNQPGYSATFDANPLFLDADGADNIYGTLDDNFQLAANSPCVDAHADASVGYADAAGNRRFFDANNDGFVYADYGAFERSAPVYAPVLMVRAGATGLNNGSSWADAFSGTLGLQSALGLASQFPGAYTEVWVAAGTYNPTTYTGPASRGVSFNLQNNVEIYGGFQGNETSLLQRNTAGSPTILNGDLLGDDVGSLNRNDNSYHIIRCDNVAASARLDGFIIERGTTLTDNLNTDSYGGGILLTSSSPTVANCTVRLNSGTYGGGLCLLSGSNPRFVNVHFLQNSAVPRVGDFWASGGAAVINSSAPRFDDCVFSENTATGLVGLGGALHITGTSSPAFVRSAFSRNVASSAGSLMWNGGGTHLADFVNCIIEGNYGASDVMHVDDSTATYSLQNCRVVGNSGYYGTVSCGRNTTLNLLGSSFVANESFGDAACCGNIAVNIGSTVNIANSLLWGNTWTGNPPEQAQVRTSPGTFNVTYSTVQGWTGAMAGIGNNGLDPVFIRPPFSGADGHWDGVDDDYGDLRLSASSPAIDSGDALAVPADTLDLDNDGNTTEALPLDLAGNPRFYDDPARTNTGNGSPPVDRGAYENNLATTRWTNPLGGRFNDNANWSGSVPTSSVRAIFDDAAGGINRAFTATLPSTQNAYTLSVLANDVTLNFRSVPGTGSLLLHGPGNDPNNAALLIGMSPAVPTSLHLINTGTIVQSLETSNAVIAGGLASIGALDVSGRRANFGATATVDVGRVGLGSFSILNESLADVETVRIGTQPGATGTVTLSGAGPIESVLLYGGDTGTGSLIVGDAGTGAISVSGVGLLGSGFAQEVVLGKQPGSSGTVTLSGADAVWSSAQDRFILGESGDATLTITGGAQLFTSTAGQITLARNAGSTAHLTIGAGSSWTEDVQSVVVAGDGEATLNLQPGSSLNFQNQLVINPRGTLSGSGTITGGVFNVGTVRVGNSPGTIQINGNYRQFPQLPGAQAGKLEMEVAGPGAGQFDQLLVSGQAELGGGLLVRFTNGYTPPGNIDLPLLVPATRSGRFDVAYVPILADQRFVRVKYPAASTGVRIELDDVGTLYSPGDPLTNTLSSPPAAAAIGDFDQANGPDLAIALPGDGPTDPGEVVVLLNQGLDENGEWLRFTEQPQAIILNVGVDPVDVVAAQMDGVNGDDLVVVNRGSNTVQVFTSSPGGAAMTLRASIPTPPQPESAAVAPFRVTGPPGTDRPDIAVALASSNSMQVFASDDTASPSYFIWGVPINFPNPPPPRRIVRPGDVDGDKRNDVVAALRDGPGNHGDMVAIYHTNADASMTNIGIHAVGDEPVAIIIKDLDGDGTPAAPRMEVITANAGDGTVSVLAGKRDRAPGDPYLNPAVNLPVQTDAFTATQVASIDAGDVDGDGKPDLAVVGVNASGDRDVFVLRNLSQPDQNTGQPNLALAQPLPMNLTNSPALVRVANVDPASPSGGTTDDVIGLNGGSGLLPQGIMTRGPAPGAAPGCDGLDFNGDGLFPDTADIDDFLSVFSGGPCSNDPLCGDLDFNNDGLYPDTLDIDSLLSVFSGGPCLL